MTASSRGSKAAALLIRSSHHPRARVCSSCLQTLTRTTYLPSTTRRPYAAASPALKPLDGPPIISDRITQLPPISPSSTNFTTHSGILLSRPPLLTQTPHPFETSFFFYQKRLNERLALPFTRYFYFKKDTPADIEWKARAKERNGAAARDLGGYDAYGVEGWNDELLVGDGRSARGSVVEALVRDGDGKGGEGVGGEVGVDVDGGKKGGSDAEGEAVERPLGRLTESDFKRDVRRLDRKLGRTLYLVVKREGKWMFPEGEVVGRENLLQAAQRILLSSAGPNMNTWIIGHSPVGHRIVAPQYASKDAISTSPSPTTLGTKTFFMKARIMAGQANLEGNAFGLEDFKWLTKEEVKRCVSDHYFSWVKNMMADR